MFKRNVVLLPLAAAFALTACSNNPAPESESPDAAPAEMDAEGADAADESADAGTIVDIAVANGSFTTLVSALEAADMVGALQGDGPLTVFAPTDDAFAKLPEGALDELLADKEKLAMVLKYHVVDGAVSSEQVVSLQEADTLAGQTVAIDASDGVKINDATVVQADINASNGVIHVIDTVLLPQ